MSISSKSLLAAAEKCRCRALEIDSAPQEGSCGRPEANSDEAGLLDKLFLELADRKRAPKVTYQLEARNKPDWQSRYLKEAYLWTETAFTSAGLLQGENAAGQRRVLEEKRQLTFDSIQALRKLAPPVKEGGEQTLFAARLNLLFRPEPLANRRGERIDPLASLERNIESTLKDLGILMNWLDEDIRLLSEFGTGRPKEIQKAEFAKQMGRMWVRITGETPSKKHDSVFGQFVAKVWLECLECSKAEANFERTLKDINKGGDKNRENKTGFVRLKTKRSIAHIEAAGS